MSMFFLTTKSQSKCFSLDVHPETFLHIKYEALDIDGEKKRSRKKPVITVTEVEVPLTKRRGKKNKPITETIDKPSGEITHETIVSGQVTVCFRAYLSKNADPLRFGLKITAGHEKINLSQDELKNQLAFLKENVEDIKYEVNDALLEENTAKGRKVVFHDQTVAMHAAAQRWPMVQILLVLVTGFIQASHMAKFFEKMHLA